MKQRTRHRVAKQRMITLLGSFLLGWLPISSLAQADEHITQGSTAYDHHGFSREAAPNPHGSEDRFAIPMEQQLNLTEQQAAEFRNIRTAYKVMTIAKTADIRVGEVELAALLDQENPDIALIEQKVSTIGGLRKDLMMGRVESLLKLKKLLKPEQYDMFHKLLQMRMETFANHSFTHSPMMGH